MKVQSRGMSPTQKGSELWHVTDTKNGAFYFPENLSSFQTNHKIHENDKTLQGPRKLVKNRIHMVDTAIKS